MEILSENVYRQKFTDELTFKLLIEVFGHKVKVTSTLKEDIAISVFYIGNMPQIIKPKLRETVNKNKTN